ncbi:MAG: rod shape-determining protein RodA [Victivallales bacterium]|jgi:rod shape determining protein RodA|nr:rod shape-determining protein RodA [Victivallales bacterium]
MRTAKKTPESGWSVRIVRCLAQYDFVQIIALGFLICTGLVFIYSTGVQIGTPVALMAFSRQLLWASCGLLLYLISSSLNLRRIEYKILSPIFYLITLGLLILLPFAGQKVNGAISWLDIPGIGFRIQPSEFAKLSLIMLLSAMFSSAIFSVNKLSWLLLSCITVAIPLFLILKEPDFGSAIILIPIYLAIVFCAGIKWKYIIVVSVISIFGLVLIAVNEIMRIRPFLKGYQLNRILAFLHPEDFLVTVGYQPYQAGLAVASGGLFGKGIGEGTQNSLGFLPQTAANNDFIFAIIAEETGFIGCILIFLAYFLLLYSMLRTAFLTDDPFGKYLCIGIAAIIFAHCFINIGMSIGITPVTGLSLPFVSYGGSFFLMLMVACGLVQSVYRHRNDGKV